MENAVHKIAFIGFGEAANAFVEGWGSDISQRVAAFDIKTDDADGTISAAKWSDYRRAGIGGRATLAETLENAAVAFSLVTADQALVAAEQAARVIGAGTLYLDCNSCSPETKRNAARMIEAAGARYVDVAIMAPVHPRLHETPVLVSGPHSDRALAMMEPLGMKAKQASADIGGASSVKMIRSVVIKGLEAVVLECVVAGERAGVSPAVLASLDDTYPGFDWHHRARYMLERMAKHGTRRAAELGEVAATLEALDLDPLMTRAAAAWQSRVGDLDIAEGADSSDLASLISTALTEQAGGVNDLVA